MKIIFFQESFRDLLIQLRDQNPEINAYSLVGRLGEVKKFEILSNDLKSFLIRESILFVGRSHIFTSILRAAFL